MDPTATLEWCDQSTSDLDLVTAREHLANYRHWRARGGFEPCVYGKQGDRFADECERRIADASL